MTLKKILLIEDEPLIQTSLKRLLEKRGAEVYVESSGNQAIKLIKSSDFDRIICDLMLQDISGFDILEEAKQRYSTGEIRDKFVIITAYSSAQVLEKAAGYNCQVISKPFDDLNRVLDIFMQEEGNN